MVKVPWFYHRTNKRRYGKLFSGEYSVFVFINIMTVFVFFFVFVSACKSYDIIVTIIVDIGYHQCRFGEFPSPCQPGYGIHYKPFASPEIYSCRKKVCCSDNNIFPAVIIQVSFCHHGTNLRVLMRNDILLEVKIRKISLLMSVRKNTVTWCKKQ